MKKYQFSLDKMRSYKQQMLDKEKNVLFGLQGERRRTEEAIEALSVQLQRVQTEFQEKMQIGTSVASMQLYEMQKQTIRMQQEQLNMQLMMLNSNIERQRRVVVRFSQEVSGLDKLEEQQLEEYQRLLMKDNEATIEEFLSFRMLRERAES